MTMEKRVHPALPRPLTSFIGREQELAQLTELLQNPACRLLTLVGPGGIGKTRLALELAAQQQESYADGVFFVALQSLSSPALLVSAIADALGCPPSGENSPQDQVLHHLRNRELLLVLDNFEHLLLPEKTSWGKTSQSEAGAALDLLSTILTETTQVQLLVTSREVLNLHEEWLFPLSGLETPPASWTPASEDAAFGAVQLFVERARHLRRDFDWAAESASVVRLCQLVEGMPLALELAATWAKTLTSTEIVSEIERNRDFLVTTMRNVPERHRNIRVIFEQSWQQLSTAEQEVFARLTVFRGGFQRAAAEEAAVAPLPLLSALIDKSLLRWEQRTGGGRYQLHELLRQFAADKLAEDPALQQQAYAQHSRYYLAYLAVRTEPLNSAAQRLALDEIGGELDNIRTAWEWALAQGNQTTLAVALEPLYEFYLIRSRYQEGAALFAASAAQLQQHHAAPDQPATAALVQQLRARQGAFLVLMGDYTAASRLLEPISQSAAPRERAFALRQLGRIAWYQMDRLTTEAYYRQSLALSQETGDQAGELMTSLSLADHLTNLGKMAEARALAEQAVAHSRSLGRPDWLADALHALAWYRSCVGEYAQAEALWQESLAIYGQIDDRFGATLATNYLGWAAWCQGGKRLTEAATYHTSALAGYQTLGTRGLAAMSLGDLALVQLDLGDYAQAKANAQAGLTITEASHSFDLMVYHLYCLGAAETGLGDFKAARTHLLRALQMAWEFQHLPHLANTLYFAAVLLLTEAEWAGVGSAECSQKRQKAGELLTELLHYPATWQAIKDRATQLLTRLSARTASSRISGNAASAPLSNMAQTVSALSQFLLEESVAPYESRANGHHTAQAHQPLVEPLTERELEILHLIAEGHTNHIIADKLILSTGTVKWYSSEIYGKLGVASRTQAVAEARRLKLIEV